MLEAQKLKFPFLPDSGYLFYKTVIFFKENFPFLRDKDFTIQTTTSLIF